MKFTSILIGALALISGSVQASTFSLDVSDMWWTPSESGWGANINQQRDILFLTFFVYGADGKAAWYVAPNVPYVSGTGKNAQYSGPLYQTDGSWFGTAFNPANTHARQVGTVTFTGTGDSSALLAYSVDGTPVSKTIQRQTWRFNDLSGAYAGVAQYTQPDCLVGGPFAPQSLPSSFRVVHSDSAFAMSVVDSFQACTYIGTYVQSGKFGSASGNFTCDSGKVGTFTATEIEGNTIAITGRFSRQILACSIDAKFSAVLN
jgi:hypothetical protein